MSRCVPGIVALLVIGAVQANAQCGYVVWGPRCSGCVPAYCVCADTAGCTHTHACYDSTGYQIASGENVPRIVTYQTPCEVIELCQKSDLNKPCHDITNSCYTTFFVLEIVSQQTGYREQGRCSSGIG